MRILNIIRSWIKSKRNKQRGFPKVLKSMGFEGGSDLVAPIVIFGASSSLLSTDAEAASISPSIEFTPVVPAPKFESTTEQKESRTISEAPSPKLEEPNEELDKVLKTDKEKSKKVDSTRYRILLDMYEKGGIEVVNKFWDSWSGTDESAVKTLESVSATKELGKKRASVWRESNNIVIPTDVKLEDVLSSKYYTYTQLSKTSTGLPNVPSELVRNRLYNLCVRVLYPIRDLLGRLPVVSSAYRSEAVNKRVGGDSNSQHKLGEASDISYPGLTPVQLAQMVIDAGILYDQLIVYDNFIHISLKYEGTQRHMLLRGVQKGVRYSGLMPVVNATKISDSQSSKSKVEVNNKSLTFTTPPTSNSPDC